MARSSTQAAKDYWRRQMFNSPTPPVRDLPEAEMRRLRLDAGGYDRSGRYYGRGEPVFDFQICLPTGRCTSGAVRATSKAEAKAKIRAKFPGTKFVKGGL